jgi:uncharacterized membrane protein
MKKVLLTLLALVLTVGLLGAAGFAGYQFGYRQGALSTSNGNAQVSPLPRNNGPRGMPMMPFGFGRGFGFGPRGFGIIRHGGMMGFGFFGPLMLLLRILFWVLVIWVIYLLITRSGWRLTRQSTANPPASAQPSAPAESNDNEPVGD